MSDSLMCSPNEGKGPKSSIWSVLELCGEAFTVVLNLPWGRPTQTAGRQGFAVFDIAMDVWISYTFYSDGRVNIKILC